MEFAATPDTAPAPEGMSDAERIEHALDAMEAEDEGALAPEGVKPNEAGQDDGGDPEQQTEAPSTYRVKVRGQDVEVTLDELTKGYSRTEDYKAKTAEVAEARRQVEAEKAAAAAERQRYAQALDQYVNQAQALDPVIAEGMKTDWVRLSQENPVEFVQRKAVFDQRIAMVNAATAEREAIQRQQTMERLQMEHAKLSEALPDWGDADKRTALVKEMVGFLGGLGFTPQEVGAVADARVILLAHKAMQAEKQEQARKAAEAKRVAPAPMRTQRPATPSANGRANAHLAAMKSKAMRGGTNDVVDFVMAALEQDP